MVEENDVLCLKEMRRNQFPARNSEEYTPRVIIITCVSNVEGKFLRVLMKSHIQWQTTHFSLQILSDDHVDLLEAVLGRLTVQNFHRVDVLDGQQVLKCANVLT